MNAFTKDLTAVDVHQPTSLGNDFAPRRRRPWTQAERDGFIAFGTGPETERLKDLYDSQLRGNPHSPEAAFAAAWMWMGVKGQEAIRAEEAGEALPIKGNLKMEKGEQVGALLSAVGSVFGDAELSKSEREYVLSEVAAFYKEQTGRDAIEDIRSVRAAREAKPLSKSAYIDAVHRVAESKRGAGETLEQARAKYWQSNEGRTVRQALKRLPADEPAPRAQPVVSAGLAAFHKAAEARAARDGVPLNVAKLAIVDSRQPSDVALWRAARA
jgi:hypothetical protein